MEPIELLNQSYSTSVVLELLNCLILITLPAIKIYDKSATLFPVFHRGFFCDDQTIMYPYKKSTVPYWTIGILFPVLFVLCMAPLVMFQMLRGVSSKKLDRTENCKQVTLLVNHYRFPFSTLLKQLVRDSNHIRV